MDLINSIDNDINNIHDQIYLQDEKDVSKLLKNKENMYIFQTNIRSLGNMDQFIIYGKEFIRDLHVIIFTETWSNDKKITHSIPNFSGYFTENFINQNSGVAVFIRNDVNIIEVKELSFSYANCLMLEVLYNNKKIVLLAVYRSPQGNRESIFINELNVHLNFLNNKINHVLLLGDINIDILPSSRLGDEKDDYLDTLSHYGLISKLCTVTRVNRENPSLGTCIDHIFSHSSIELNSYVLQSFITDHFSTIAAIKLNNFKQTDIERNKTLKKIDYNQLKNQLNQVEWSDLYLKDNIDNIADDFLNILIKNIEIATSEETLRKKYLPIKPWITPGLVKSIRKRDELAKQCLRSNNERMKKYYKKYRNGLNIIIRHTKDKYYENKINQVSGNKKKLWLTLNDITNRQRQSQTIHNIEHNDTLIDALKEPVKVSNIFNSHFVKVGEGVANTIPDCENRDILIEPVVTSIFDKFKIISEDEVLKHINSLRGGSGPGADGITAVTLKNIANEILKPLTFIVNKSLQDGIFPKCCKLALVTPIYKSSKKTLVNNFRPIGLQSNISKIIEKCVKTELTQYLDKHNLLPDSQFGFREKIGTEDALLNFSNYLHKTIADNKKTLVAYLDLNKAFDSIKHSKLIETLKKLGIKNFALSWFRSYLSDRTQRVKINGLLGEPLSLGEYSLIQGTVISPVLFNCFVSSLPLNTKSKIFSFADDTALCYEADSWDEVHRIANEDLKKIKNWFDSMSLKLNTAKTCYTTFSITNTGQPTASEIFIHSCSDNTTGCNCPKIERKECVKYLGILVDQHLKFKQHILNIASKIRYISSIFIKLKNMASINIKKMLYYALIQSIIEYGLVIWGKAYASETIKVDRAQNTILRIILKRERRSSAIILYENLNLLTLKKLYLLKLLKYCIKCAHIWETRQTPYSIRVDQPILVPQVKSEFSKNSFLYRGALMYNQLPPIIRNLDLSKMLHKKVAKEWIFKNYEDIKYIST